MNILVAWLLIFGVTLSPGQMPAGTDTPGLSRDQTPAGTTLIHFSRVDAGVYKGSKPRSDADYRFLQSLHVKYIVDLQVIPLAYRLEKRKAARPAKAGVLSGRQSHRGNGQKPRSLDSRKEG